nr:hypothetical protein Cry52Nrm2_p160 [Cryptomonas curvata]
MALKITVNLSSFIIGMIIKITQQFIGIFCKRKNDFRIVIILVKFGDYINRNLIFSSIGISLFDILKDRFGCRVIIQLIKLNPEKKRIFLSLINYKINEYVCFKNSCQVIEFLFQNLSINKEKIFFVATLNFFSDFIYSNYAYRFYNKIYTIRTFFSGFSLHNKNKLKLAYINRIKSIDKNMVIYAPSLSSILILELLRFNYKIKKSSLHKLIFQYGIFIANFPQGLSLISNLFSHINLKNLYSFLIKIFSILPNFLKNRYGHITVLLIIRFIDANHKISQISKIIDILLLKKNLFYKYSQYIYLYILNPTSKIFYKKKQYKIIESYQKKSIIYKLNINNKTNLYNLFKEFLIFEKLNSLQLILRHFIEHIKLSKKNKTYVFLNYFIEKKIEMKKYPIEFEKIQNIFFFLKHISRKKKKIESKIFIFYLFEFYFNRVYWNNILYLLDSNFFRFFFFSNIYNKKTILIQYNKFLKVFLPIKLQSDNNLDLLLLDRLTFI